jgi:prepilin-type processing-associated H-X9-DG protein
MWNRTESSHSEGREMTNVMEPLESRQMFSVALLSGAELTTEVSTSSHPGGMNVAMCDGSVRFVSSSVSPTTW